MLTVFSASQVHATGGNSNNQKNNTINAGGSGNITTSKSTAYGGNSKNTVKNHSKNKLTNDVNNNVNNRNNNRSNASQGQETNIKIEQKAPEIPVNTATATPGTVNHRGCRSGFAAGGQGKFFGVTVSSTTDDPNCEVRLNSEQFLTIGDAELARLNMCFIEQTRILLEYKGYDCSFVDVLNQRNTHTTQDDPNSP